MAETTQQSTSAISHLDLGITLALNNWPALTLAVQSQWGGPTSADKRDWLCGAISEMIADRPETDAEDLEDVLVQVMNDEFDVVVDDESAASVAVQIMQMREQIASGDTASIQQLWEEWQRKNERKGAGGADAAAAAMFKKVETRDEDQETDDDEDDDGDDDGDMDMTEAPALVRAPREKVEPEVDEDGFTKVVGRKKR
ncbi:hypothetical protein ASPZODRAFT_139509 [Penicilliopsis zonata CBS 506.65]|uniref:Pre-rRNA-processing protein TSR2 n=1 Tax=Penicilliopsis zonata CBS 506.65 TaxID=1073090 RepID=A0A1L9SSW0_9EURO|nr:hypothetical protein ASPZODRAFT_139509 [Penicilliopsis zonata CBS 506.65]OJJ50191.1 hypothetical protein ASPZODRAFT_139509 [Penicilliopsis zonata CBS 506.65]